MTKYDFRSLVSTSITMISCNIYKVPIHINDYLLHENHDLVH